MKLMMTGLDHKRADLAIREIFALTKEKAGRILATVKASGGIGGCVIISTCNRTELYVSVPDRRTFKPAGTLCEMLGRKYEDYAHYFTEKTGDEAIGRLCRVASGLDSQIVGDDQIITQVREALEFSRAQRCTDSYIETMFRMAIQAAKAIKTHVILKTLGTDSVPEQTVAKLKQLCPPTGRSAVVIGNGQMGRLVSELLLREGANVTVTLREYKKGIIQVPENADTIGYSERYAVIGKADIVVSATTSPHYTLYYNELTGLARLPEVFVDLAVPRDIEPSVGDIPGVTLLTVDEISRDSRALPPESVARIDEIVEEHVEKYNRWFEYKRMHAHSRPRTGVS